MRLLCLTALSISGYLAWTSFQAGEVFGCSGGSLIDCEHVLHSKYSKVLGIPVTVPAFALYVTLLSALFFFRKSASERLLKVSWIVLTVGAISAAGAAIWFTGLQFAEMKFCQYCLVAHSCGVTLATIVLLKNPLDLSTKTRFSGMAITGVLAMVSVQWQSEAPPTFVVETFPESSTIVEPGSDLAFTAPGEFAPPGINDGPEEFGAPGMSSAPTEFAPPVFAPPVFDAPVFDAPVLATSNESNSNDLKEPQSDTQASQLASLVPPPINITQGESDVETTSKQTDPEVLEAKKTDPPTPMDEPDSSSLPLEAIDDVQATQLAGPIPKSSVEFTPPMEVPVIFATGEPDIQRVDFRVEDGSTSIVEEPETDEAATAVPSTSEDCLLYTSPSPRDRG